MWEGIFSILFLLFKYVAEKSESKKLSDEEFLKHIEAFQKQRAEVGNQAQDFEDNLEDAYREIQKEQRVKNNGKDNSN